MSPDYVALRETKTVAEALDALRRTELPEETVTTVLMYDDDRHLTGVVSVVALLKHPPQAVLADAKSPAPLTLEADDDLAEVAMKMADYDLTVAPVVDGEGAILGIVTVDDLLEMMIPEDWRRRVAALGGE
jgi:Mg/Co/Ni transporter MgtE